MENFNMENSSNIYKIDENLDSIICVFYELTIAQQYGT